MEELLQSYNNMQWLIALAAKAGYPDYIGPYYQDQWRLMYWHGFLRLTSEYRTKFLDIRWDLVRQYALRRMHKFLLGFPLED